MSLVVPAYNEKDRLGGMLEEAVNYLERMYGTLARGHIEEKPEALRQRKGAANGYSNGGADATGGRKGGALDKGDRKGWEIVIVSDGSTDSTEDVVFSFARDHQLSLHPKGRAGPWTPEPQEGVHIPPGTIRVVNLEKNRGKGGAVTHGMRHVRGQYVIFADADGATNFADLGKLVYACQEVEDTQGRGIAVGSRAHMVGSDAVVKVRYATQFATQVSGLTIHAALQTPQFPHALLPPNPLAPDALQNSHNQRHPMRLQALLPRLNPRHHPLHAL